MDEGLAAISSIWQGQREDFLELDDKQRSALRAWRDDWGAGLTPSVPFEMAVRISADDLCCERRGKLCGRRWLQVKNKKMRKAKMTKRYWMDLRS